MNLRHTAALALIGWLMLTLPLAAEGPVAVPGTADVEMEPGLSSIPVGRARDSRGVRRPNYKLLRHPLSTYGSVTLAVTPGTNKSLCYDVIECAVHIRQRLFSLAPTF